ncbi:MAG TPA: DUF2269 family protein [Gaiellaceae bacterium]|nr:DUF2269 family protein [Gaiellaceae bacterium]
MALTHVLLFFHLLGAICFFAGGAVVGVLQLAAIRRERPSEIHALLRLAPFGAALVGSGALLTLGFGIGLAEHEGLGLSPAWIEAALGLWVAAMALGGYGGRTARHARHLAEKLAAEGDAPSPELRELVGARGPLYASYASFLMLLAILALMVWQPGAPSRFSIPAPLRAQILAGDRRVADVPTRVPAGYSLADDAYDFKAYTLSFVKAGSAFASVDFSVQIGCSSEKPFWAQRRLRLNGAVLLDHFGEDGQQVWECRNGVLLEAATPDYGVPARDLATLVAYAEPLR